MGLESATYIDDLVVSNPLGTDSKSQGDNHIRLIKSTLKNSFPNLGAAAVTATAAEINDIFDSNRAMPTGGIIMWSGSTATVPTGWAICDGTSGTPNLVGRFIVGSKTDAGGTYDIGDTGGSTSTTSGAHTLTLAEIPSHSHTLVRGSFNASDFNGASDFMKGGLTASSPSEATDSKGGGGSHSHSVSITPPYYALAYIMKL